MSFKKLNSGDFSLSVAPIITQIDSPTFDEKNGKDIGGKSTNISFALANIVGNEYDVNDGQYHYSCKRKDFRQSIHPETFRVDGVGIDSGSVTITKAGRKFDGSDGRFVLYPDIGVFQHTQTGMTVGQMCSEEYLTTSYVTVRILPSEFNYSTNPSFSANGGSQIKDPYLLNPVTYITTIGLYNDDGDLLAIAKTGKPLKKDFVTSYSLHVQLDF